MSDLAKVGLIIGLCVVICYFYGEASKKAGVEQANNTWLAKFATAVPETLITHDTLWTKPETLKTIVYKKNDTVKVADTLGSWIPHDPRPSHHTLESIQKTFLDTTGGTHDITVKSGEIGEVYTPGKHVSTVLTVTKEIPVNVASKEWLFGISAEYEDRLGLGLILSKKPLYFTPKYYPSTKSWGAGIGIYTEF